jgi:ATP-dependent Clp protease adaptor protein ClpS
MSAGIWCVLMFNDTATPMEFVVRLLQKVFQKDADEAQRITLDTHHNGITICAVYNRREHAVSKVAEACRLAREHGHPLLLRYACGDVVLEPMLSRREMIIIKWLRDIDKQVWKAFWQGA